jgi:hypothetical protein
MHRLLRAEFSDQRSLKKIECRFFGLKNHFSPKTHRKHSKHIDKLIHNLKNN